METNDRKAMREALDKVNEIYDILSKPCIVAEEARQACREARGVLIPVLSAPPRTGKWKNGRKYEYEYAYCSACGRAQWAGWDCHKEAEEKVESFADNYRFCPGCGARMEGGVYVK